MSQSWLSASFVLSDQLILLEQLQDGWPYLYHDYTASQGCMYNMYKQLQKLKFVSSISWQIWHHCKHFWLIKCWSMLITHHSVDQCCSILIDQHLQCVINIDRSSINFDQLWLTLINQNVYSDVYLHPVLHLITTSMQWRASCFSDPLGSKMFVSAVLMH